MTLRDLLNISESLGYAIAAASELPIEADKKEEIEEHLRDAMTALLDLEI